MKKDRWIPMFILLLNCFLLGRIHALHQVWVLVDSSSEVVHFDPKDLRAYWIRSLPLPIQQNVELKVSSVRGDLIKDLLDWQDLRTMDLGTLDKTSKRLGRYGKRSDWFKVLFSALQNWKEQEKEAIERTLIICSAGPFGPSALASTNFVQKEELAETLISALKSQKIKLISVSIGTESEDCLFNIARVTDGQFYKVNKALEAKASVQEIFGPWTHPFGSTPQKHHFEVSFGQQQITLFFSTPQESSLRIIDPKGKVFTPKDSQASIRWYLSGTEAFITLYDPIPGNWILESALLPSQPLEIYSNLSLILEPEEGLKEVLFGQNYFMQVKVLADNKPVKNLKFLKHVQVRGQWKGSSTSNTWLFWPDDMLSPIPSKETGAFFLQVPVTGVSGENLFYVEGLGPTFVLSDALQVSVCDTLIQLACTRLSDNLDPPYARYELSIIPTMQSLDPEEVRLEMSLSPKNGLVRNLHPTWDPSRNCWYVTFILTPELGLVEVRTSIQGKWKEFFFKRTLPAFFLSENQWIKN